MRRIAAWIHGAFWTRSGKGVDVVEDLLRQADDPDRIPLALLALVDEEPAGTVNLVASDSRARADLIPWLAALFVSPEHRGKGIGEGLVRTLIAEAATLGVTEVFLETDIPEFYARLGAARYEALPEGAWIMRIAIQPERRRAQPAPK